EIAKRRSRGELITLLQIEDSDGRRWRRYETFSLAAAPPRAKSKTIFYFQEFFVVPGDYKISVAVCDSNTSEYSFARRALHVARLHNDPLPAASVDLPPLEFVSPFGSPDSWFQPYVRGRLSLPIVTATPVRIEVMLNLSLSERAAGSLSAFRRNMSVLVPALKVLAEMRPAGGVVNITLLDLTKRKIWEQKEIRELKWDRIREPFAEANPGVIDAQSLAAKGQMTQFFWDQVLLRLRANSHERRVGVILGSPIFLEHQIRVEPAAVPRDASRKVFYLRYRPLPRRPPVSSPTQGGAPVPQAPALPSDDIEHTLRALDSRNFNLLSPVEFRKALAAIIDAIRTWVE
ncbi:MAG: hypothetical protein KGN84_05900, partial [Acidobacteriota bacterium]|nr:hypothetical protein [Acidobacteriota bacterium]